MNANLIKEKKDEKNLEASDNKASLKDNVVEKNQAEDSSSELEAMETVRSVLFGNQVKEIYKKLDVEAKSNESRIEKLNSNFLNRLKNLEKSLEHEIAKLSENHAEKSSQQQQEIGNAFKRLESLTSDLDKKHKDLVNKISASESKLESLILDRYSELQEISEKNYKELKAKIEDDKEFLDSTKLGKQELCNALLQVIEKIQA